jgi:hypothetical protein
MPRLDLGISWRHFGSEVYCSPNFGTMINYVAGAGMVTLHWEMPRSSLGMTVGEFGVSSLIRS